MISGFILGHKYSPSLTQRTRRQSTSHGGRDPILPIPATPDDCPPVLFEAEIVNSLFPINREDFIQTRTLARAIQRITGFAYETFHLHLPPWFQSFERRLPTRDIKKGGD